MTVDGGQRRLRGGGRERRRSRGTCSTRPTRSSRRDINESPYSCIFDSKLTMARRQPRQGLRLVRQRVGLLVPARRPREQARRVAQPLVRLPRSVREADVDGKVVLVRADLNVPLEDGPGRRRRAHPRLAADAAAAARPRRARGARLLAPRPPEDRGGPGAGTRSRRSRARLARARRRRPRDRAREHALRPGRDRQRRRLRARARRRLRPLRQRRLRLGPPRARLDRGASRTSCPPTPACCCSPSSSTSAGCSARSSGRS